MNRGTPFSHSQIWQQQRNFYQESGIEAWASKVPYFATSNAFLAEAYFQQITTFWQETQKQPSYQGDAPFYIIELGAGSGLFSFYLLQRLSNWRSQADIALPFVYIMTDLASANIEFWKKHPALQYHAEKGLVDFAVWDVESEQPLRTELKGIEISVEEKPQNAIVAIANYLLDSLHHELFKLTENGLQRAWVPSGASELEITEEAQKMELESLFSDLQFYPLQAEEIQKHQPFVNKIGEQYRDIQEQCDFFYPSGAIQLISTIREIGQQGVLLLVTDKGTYGHQNLHLQFKPGLVIHHSISVDVPFDILKKWVEYQGGKAIITPTNQKVQNAGFLWHNAEEAYPYTLSMIELQTVSQPSGPKLNLFKQFSTHKQLLNFQDIVAGLQLLHWDPFVFSDFFPACLNLLTSGQENLILIADFVDGLKKVADQYYYLPDTENTLAQIGLVFQTIAQFKPAIYYYHQSLSIFGDVEWVRFNIATCLIALEEWDAAASWLKPIVADNPTHFNARGQLDYCLENINTEKSKEL